MPTSSGRPAAARVLAPSRAMDASPADPLAIMACAMTRGAADPPERVFLAWLLSVPRELDPADAARRLLVRFAGRAADEGGAGRERLIELLNDTTRWPSGRLACLARGGAGSQTGRSRRRERGASR
jgi:hypothetical protein